MDGNLRTLAVSTCLEERSGRDEAPMERTIAFDLLNASAHYITLLRVGLAEACGSTSSSLAALVWILTSISTH